jgi:hypothetical protein
VIEAWVVFAPPPRHQHLSSVIACLGTFPPVEHHRNITQSVFGNGRDPEVMHVPGRRTFTKMNSNNMPSLSNTAELLRWPQHAQARGSLALRNEADTASDEAPARLPPELIPAILRFAWLDPYEQHSALFKTLSLVSRAWQAALLPIVWTDVFCLRDADFCLYLRLAIDEAKPEVAGPLSPMPIPVPSWKTEHIRARAEYLSILMRLQARPWALARRSAIHDLVYRLAIHRGPSAFVFDSAKTLTVINATDFGQAEDDLPIAPFMWVAQARDLVDLRLFGFDKNVGYADDERDPLPPSIARFRNPRIERMTLASDTRPPWNGMPYLIRLYDGVRELELRTPTQLKALVSNIPLSVDILIIKCAPMTQLGGRSSVLGWMIGQALDAGLMAPRARKDDGRRVVARTGHEEPLGWPAAVRAAERNGVVLVREVVY